MGDTGRPSFRPDKGQNKISDSFSVCEDCGRQWTAVCVDVPVNIFVKDMAVYNEKLKNIESNSSWEPFVIAIFRPKGVAAPMDATLSCVVPQDDCGYGWRVCHSALGRRADSGCQLIPRLRKPISVLGATQNHSDKVNVSNINEANVLSKYDRNHIDINIDVGCDDIMEDDSISISSELRENLIAMREESEEDKEEDKDDDQDEWKPGRIRVRSKGLFKKGSEPDGVVKNSENISRTITNKGTLSTTKNTSENSHSVAKNNFSNLENNKVNINIYKNNEKTKIDNEKLEGIIKEPFEKTIKEPFEPMEVESTNSVYNNNLESNANKVVTNSQTKHQSYKGHLNQSSNEKKDPENTDSRSKEVSQGKEKIIILNKDNGKEETNNKTSDNTSENKAGNSKDTATDSVPKHAIEEVLLKIKSDNEGDQDIVEVSQEESFNFDKFPNMNPESENSFSGIDSEPHFMANWGQDMYSDANNMGNSSGNHSPDLSWMGEAYSSSLMQPVGPYGYVKNLKEYQCPECDFRCSGKRPLKAHMISHTEGRDHPYRCNVCNYSCAVKNSLKLHMRTHTGEKPYGCPHCNYRCSVSSSLVIHMRTHTGERPYQCELCDKRFAQKCNLMTHIKQHHDGVRNMEDMQMQYNLVFPSEERDALMNLMGQNDDSRTSAASNSENNETPDVSIPSASATATNTTTTTTDLTAAAATTTDPAATTTDPTASAEVATAATEVATAATSTETPNESADITAESSSNICNSSEANIIGSSKQKTDDPNLATETGTINLAPTAETVDIGPSQASLIPDIGPSQVSLVPDIGPSQVSLVPLPDIGPSQVSLVPDIGPSQVSLVPDIGLSQVSLVPDTGPSQGSLVPDIDPRQISLLPSIEPSQNPTLMNSMGNMGLSRDSIMNNIVPNPSQNIMHSMGSMGIGSMGVNMGANMAANMGHGIGTSMGASMIPGMGTGLGSSMNSIGAGLGASMNLGANMPPHPFINNMGGYGAPGGFLNLMGGGMERYGGYYPHSGGMMGTIEPYHSRDRIMSMMNEAELPQSVPINSECSLTPIINNHMQ